MGKSGTNSLGAGRPSFVRMKAADVGLLILDRSFKPIYANNEAVQILSYPSAARKVQSLERTVRSKIKMILPSDEQFGQPDSLTEFISGKRHYMCRALAVSPRLGESSGEDVALVLERAPATSFALNRICEKYRLTMREGEAVANLARGLSGKEIAAHMKVSPNTVKAFLRLAMIKMGVDTRSGIMARIIESQL